MYVCLSGALLGVCVSRMRADSALAGSAAHHTANCWLHSTCFVLALLCSAPIISLGACTELDRELCLTHCYSSLSLQLFSPWFSIAEGTSVRVSSKPSIELVNIWVQQCLLIPLISLWSWSLFTQCDDIMTIRRGSVPFHFLSLSSLVCVLGQFGMQADVGSRGH